MSDQDEIIRVQESVVPQLLAQPGVTGVAVGFREKDGKLTDEIVIRVYVQDKRPLAEVPAELRIPSEIGGFKTDVIQKGPDVPSVLEEFKLRPLVSGLEISRVLSGGRLQRGTIGCFVSDKLPDNIRSQAGQPGFATTQRVYLLSAWPRSRASRTRGCAINARPITATASCTPLSCSWGAPPASLPRTRPRRSSTSSKPYWRRRISRKRHHSSLPCCRSRLPTAIRRSD